MLVFRCNECGAQLKLKDEMAGKKVRCASCNAVVTAPAEAGDATAVTASPKGQGRSAAITDEPSRGRSRPDAAEDENDRPRGKPATSGKAIAALLLSIANCLCLPFILTLPSLILGVLALMDISRQKGRLTGKGMAITGIALTVAGNLVYVALVVVVLLVGPAALLPAALNVQAASRRMETVNNLKQIGISMHNYHDTYKHFPPAPGMGPVPDAQPKLSWRVGLLPYVEQAPLFNQFNPQVAWDQQPNQPLISHRPKVYETPIHPTTDLTTTYIQVCTGPNSLFSDPKTPIRIPQSIPDGTSNTILTVQAMANPVPWTKPADIMMTPPGQPLPPGLQKQPGQPKFVVGMCDGSVRIINRERISDQTLRLAIDPRDGQPLPPDWDAP